MPEKLDGREYYQPTAEGLEARLKERLEWIRRRRERYPEKEK